MLKKKRLPPSFLHITTLLILAALKYNTPRSVYVCVCVNVGVWIPLYCLASHPVCCSVECGTAAYCTRQMSLRCHFAAPFLLIFLTLRSEQSPPHPCLHSLSYLLSLQYSRLLQHKTDHPICTPHNLKRFWEYTHPYSVDKHNAAYAYTVLSFTGVVNVLLIQ